MALVFSGTTQNLFKSTAVVSVNPMTFACWYKTAVTASTYSLINICSTTTSDYFLMDIPAAKVRARFITGGVGNNLSSTASITANVWLHCCIVTTSTTETTYLNGVGNSNSFGAVTPTGMVRTSIGALYNGNTTATNFANGTIAFPAIWNIALSASDVGSLFAGASPRLVHPEALVSYSMLDETSPIDTCSSTAWTLNGAPTLGVNPAIYRP